MAQIEPERFRVALGDKGRLVLPAALRKAGGLRPGDRLLAQLEPDGSIRLVKAVSPVQAMRGRYRHLTTGKSIVDELIADRREEARRDEE